MDQPLDALVSRFEEKVWAEAREEEGDAGVQLLVDLLGLDAALQGHRGRAEEGALKLQECRLDSQQLLQPRAAWTRKGRTDGMKVREETGQNGRTQRGGRDSPRAKKVLLSMDAASLGSKRSEATSLRVSRLASL